MTVEALNEIFTPLPFEDRIRALYRYFAESEVLYTSSFGTKSVFLLHLISQIRPTQTVHFIDTTYHFPETLAYRDQLAEKFGLEIINVTPDPVQNALTSDESWWQDHPKMCCSINKVVPLEPIVAKHKVWISGLMSDQTNFRSNLRIFEQQGDIIKFHPILDIDEGEFLYHLAYHKLPAHPLEAQGYGSIGCTHCTAKGSGREGRWKGSEQKECGLHPSYFLKTP
ncbi:MAG: phosphoadenosine phosphosulfate reductase [Saprospiraceae bacterium]|nr:MAG: phosphoadenosine phosphosulfate reductase [Saprospiraceae bacterium]